MRQVIANNNAACKNFISDETGQKILFYTILHTTYHDCCHDNNLRIDLGTAQPCINLNAIVVGRNLEYVEILYKLQNHHLIRKNRIVLDHMFRIWYDCDSRNGKSFLAVRHLQTD